MSADTRSILSWDRLREFLGALRFRKRLVSGIAILIAGASLLASAERQTVYESRAKVLVGSPLLDSDESTGAATNALVTEAELAQSSPVVNLVRNRVGHSVPPAQLVREVTVDTSNPSAASILIFTYTSANPGVAEERVQAFADAYLQFRTRGALAGLAQRSATLAAEAKILEKESKSFRRQAGLTNDREQKRLLSQKAVAAQHLAQQRRLSRLLLPHRVNAGVVVQPASGARPTSSSNLPAIGIVGLLIGTLAGVATTAVGRYMDERLHSPAELESMVDAPILASIPPIRLRGRRRGGRVALRARGFPAAETFRALHAVVDARRGDLNVVFITSADPTEGKSTIAANLAIASAQGGLRVALVCCNPQRPVLHRLFRTLRTPGLAEVIGIGTNARQGRDGAVELRAAVRSAGIPNLGILTFGARAPKSRDVLASPRFGWIVNELRGAYDLVILDGPPISAGSVADALAVAAVSDVTLFVANAAIGWVDRIDEARRQLEGIGAPLMGAVLNNSREGEGGDGHRIGSSRHAVALPSAQPVTPRPSPSVPTAGRA